MGILPKPWNQMNSAEKVGSVIGIIIGFSLVAWVVYAAVSNDVTLFDILNWIVGAIGQYLFWVVAITVGAVIIVTCFPGVLIIIIGCIALVVGIFLFSAISGLVGLFG